MSESNPDSTGSNEFESLPKHHGKSNSPPPGEPSEDPPAGALPQGVPAPPLPDPDLVDPETLGPTYAVDNEGRAIKRGRSHPTDPYSPLKKQTGCKSCFGCLAAMAALLILSLMAILTVLGVHGPLRPILDGHKYVRLSDSNSIISEAPEIPTYFVGETIHYTAPLTSVPVAFAGEEITLSGDFHEEVTATAERVTGKSTARFAKDLVLFTPYFVNEGILLKGERKGRVMKTSP
ncbi:MAG: hypothetical protein AAGA96_06500 [Verrucomicrobiota bacterium]